VGFPTAERLLVFVSSIHIWQQRETPSPLERVEEEKLREEEWGGCRIGNTGIGRQKLGMGIME